MKKLTFLEFILTLLFLELISKVSSSEIIWDFEKTAINLLSDSDSYNYTITQGNVNNTEFRLKKIITKKGNNITHKNILYIDQNPGIEVNFEDIDKFYNIKGVNYICPTGKNYMLIYNKNNSLSEKIPKDFNSNDNWELKCYYHEEKDILLTFFLIDNNDMPPKIYKYEFGSESLEETKIRIRAEIRNLFSFQWKTDNLYANKDSFIGVTYSSVSIDLHCLYFNYGENDIEHIKAESIINSFYKIKVNNDYNRNVFYFINYLLNSNKIESGYINDIDKITQDNISTYQN